MDTIRGYADGERIDIPVDVAVTEAIALLDEFGPDGWRERVNLDQLEMMDSRWCVLGQVWHGEARHRPTYGSGWMDGSRHLRHAAKARYERLCNAFADEATLDEWKRQLGASA